MARREVIEVVCDRCSRTETQAQDAVYTKANEPEAEFLFQGEKVSYEDLCRRCRDTLANYFAKVTKAKPDAEADEQPVVAPVDAPEPTEGAQATVKKGGLFGGRKTG